VPVAQAAVQRSVPLIERIAAAAQSFGSLTKDSKNDYLKSSYLGLPGLLKAIKQPLLEQGIVIYTQIVKSADSSFVVRTTLSNTDGKEEISSDFPIFDVSNMHKIGASVTYGTRYNLLALLAICPDTDDDGSGSVYGSQSATLPAGLPGGVSYAQQPPPMPPSIAYPAQPLPVLSQ
jgi:hypothetical protein